MPQLIKNISATVIDDIEGPVTLFKSISAQGQSGIYINVCGLVAFMQDYSSVETLESLQHGNKYGPLTIGNEITIEISY